MSDKRFETEQDNTAERIARAIEKRRLARRRRWLRSQRWSARDESVWSRAMWDAARIARREGTRSAAGGAMSQKATTTLADFLLARIAEDEVVANVCTAWDDTRSTLQEGGRYVEASPARVLAECEAKRRIVELHADPIPLLDGPYWRHELRHLALPYADHEDFRDEWRP